MKKIAYLYVFDTLADWEAAYVTAELQSGQCFKDKTLQYEVQTVSVTTDPVRTMGGLKILPDLTLSELNLHDAGLFILPGGFTWTEPFHAPVFEKVRACLEAHIPVAAICATYASMLMRHLRYSLPCRSRIASTTLSSLSFAKRP